MTARIEVTQDEIAEKIDELAGLCALWTVRRNDGCPARVTRQQIVMTAQDIASLVRVQEVGR